MSAPDRSICFFRHFHRFPQRAAQTPAAGTDDRRVTLDDDPPESLQPRGDPGSGGSDPDVPDQAGRVAGAEGGLQDLDRRGLPRDGRGGGKGFQRLSCRRGHFMGKAQDRKAVGAVGRDLQIQEGVPARQRLHPGHLVAQRLEDLGRGPGRETVGAQLLQPAVGGLHG